MLNDCSHAYIHLPGHGLPETDAILTVSAAPSKVDDNALETEKTIIPDISNINGQETGIRKADEGQNDVVGLLYSLVLEERTRTARLEHELLEGGRQKEFDKSDRLGLPVRDEGHQDKDQETPLTTKQKLLALLNTSTILENGLGGGL